MWTLVGSKDTDLLQVTEQIYKVGYVVEPSIFSCSQYDDLMKELQKELSECLTQAGLQGERGLAKASFRTWRCSQGPQGEEDPAFEARLQGMQSWQRDRRTCSRVRSGSRQWQSPSSSCHSQLQPCSPIWSCPDEQLHHSLEGLNLEPRNWAWQ